MLKTKPITLTRVTGVSFFAVWKLSWGISTFGVRKAAAWSKMTARISCMRRNNKGSSGVEFRTALFLRARSETGKERQRFVL